MILQNICRRDVGSVLINISSSNIFPTMLSLKRFHQNRQAAFGHKLVNVQFLPCPFFSFADSQYLYFAHVYIARMFQCLFLFIIYYSINICTNNMTGM